MNFPILFSIYISNIFSPQLIFLLTLLFFTLLVFYLYLKNFNLKILLSVNCPNQIKLLILLLLSMIIASVLVIFLKYYFHIPRPINMLIDEKGYSFPSGHTILSFTIAFMIIYNIFKYFRHKYKYIDYLYSIFFLLIAFLISYSRLLLQVHRPIDIIGGIFFAFISTYLSIKIYYNINKYVNKKIIK